MISATFIVVFYRITPSVVSTIEASILSSMLISILGKKAYTLIAIVLFLLLFTLYSLSIVFNKRLLAIITLTSIFVYEGIVALLSVFDAAMFIILLIMVLNMKPVISGDISTSNTILHLLSLILTITIIIVIPYSLMLGIIFILRYTPVLYHLSVVYLKSKFMVLASMLIGLYIALILHERIREFICYILRGVHLTDVVDDDLYSSGLKGVIPLDIRGFDRILIELNVFMLIMVFSPCIMVVLEKLVYDKLVSLIISLPLSFIIWVCLRLFIYKLFTIRMLRIDLRRAKLMILGTILIPIIIITLLLAIPITRDIILFIFLNSGYSSWARQFDKAYLKVFKEMNRTLNLFIDILWGK